MAEEGNRVDKNSRDGYWDMLDGMRIDIDSITGEKNKLLAQADTPDGYYQADSGLNGLYFKVDDFSGLRGELVAIHEDIREYLEIKAPFLTPEIVKHLPPDQQEIALDYIAVEGFVEDLKNDLSQSMREMEMPKDMMAYAEERFDNIVVSLKTYKDYADKGNAEPETLRAFAAQIEEDEKFLLWLSTMHYTTGHNDFKLPDEKQGRIHTEILPALKKYKELFSL